MTAGSTSRMKQDLLRTATLTGVDATLRKPFAVDHLLEVVRKVLEPQP